MYARYRAIAVQKSLQGLRDHLRASTAGAATAASPGAPAAGASPAVTSSLFHSFFWFCLFTVSTVEFGYVIHGIYHPAASIGHFRPFYCISLDIVFIKRDRVSTASNRVWIGLNRVLVETHLFWVVLQLYWGESSSFLFCPVSKFSLEFNGFG